MSISTRTGTIALGLVIAAIAATSGMANSNSPAANGVQCGISKSTQNGMQVLEGVLLSPKQVSGEYRFAIQSFSNGGSSNISQGGEFIARAGEETRLGNAMINAGAKTNVTFEVTANGKKLDCSQDLVRQL